MTMQTVIQRYNLLLFDELNILGEKIEKKTAQEAVDDFVDYLIDAYIEGFSATAYMLGDEIEVDTESLSKTLNKSYDGESIYDKFVKYLSENDKNSLMTLIESEAHRTYGEGGISAANLSDGNISKRWVTMLDDKVRDTHAYLEGVSIPLSDKFTTTDGDSALAPGGFAKAENNVNCRCILQFEKS